MSYKHILVLTGAGISAESGIPVFRAEDGLWENHRVEDVATPEGFERNPQLVHDFYNTMRRSVKEKQPNPAHLALTKLQTELEKQGGTVTIVTQNIDDLHEKAKSHDVIHMHGELNSILCEHCGKSYEWHEDCDGTTVCKFCGTRPCAPTSCGLVRSPTTWQPLSAQSSNATSLSPSAPRVWSIRLQALSPLARAKASRALSLTSLPAPIAASSPKAT